MSFLKNNADEDLSSVLQTAKSTRSRQWEAAEAAAGSNYDVLPQAKDSEAVFKKIDISLVDESPFNARKFYDPDKIQKLAGSIKLDGQLIPAMAVVRGDRYMLIGGHYRYKAIRMAGIETIDAMVYPEGSITDQDIYVYSFKENTDRSPQTPLDNAFAWKELLDDGVYASETELSERIGVSMSNINKTLAILRLPAAVLDVVKENPDDFGLSMLYELEMYSRLASEVDAVKIAEKIQRKEITRQDLSLLRSDLQGDNSKPTRKNKKSLARTLKYGDSEGVIKEWESGKIQVEVNFDDKEKMARFLKYVERFE